MGNFFGHLRTINRHKRMVMKYCFKIGLYKQGLLHDLSKYSPTEFIPGVKYFCGDQSPNNAERKLTGMSKAWLHHKGRNKHHLEYWIDYSPEGDHMMTGMKMPVKYVAEMLCDRVAASKIYQGKNYTDAHPYEYFQNGRDKRVINDETSDLLESLLLMLKEEGEEKTFDYIKNELLKKGDY